MSKLNDFVKKLKEMPNTELVATYQYVSGLFYSQRKEMHPKAKETATDLNLIKEELLFRLSKGL